MKTYHHLLVCLLLKIAAIARAEFLFEFEIVRHRTNGNCLGFDFTIPCETFVNDFCLRGPSFLGNPRNYDRNNCPLGKNTDRVFETVPAQRAIQSSEPWPGVFQLFIGAHDDDYPATTFDFLDNIFVDRSKTVSNEYSSEETIWGDNDKVGVDIRFRVTCVQHFYRADCSQYCLARNDNSGHYTCNPADGSKICNSGYEHPETNCVDLITACSSSPCDHGGTCSPIGLTEFTCSCPPGYTGRRCEMEIDECLNNTVCLNGGNCTDLLADYSCSCVTGFTGKSCEVDINECLEVVCVGNATCVHGINQYECVCNPGFEGHNCTEIDPCAETPCAATGECLSSSPFNYTCLCDSGYTSQHCEVNIDDCVAATCPEDSDCMDGVESYSCDCHVGFVGENCTSLGVTGAGSGSATGPAIGGAVGGLLALIIILLIVILVVVMIFARARRRSKSEYSIPQNPYASSPVDDSPAHILNNSLYIQTDDPLINNPLYTMTTSTSPTSDHVPIPDQLTRRSPEFDMSSSPAYDSARNINNPLYGVKSPERKADPIYAELEGPPPQGAANQPQKGANNYPYSYAVLEGNRRPTAGVPVAPPPGYEQTVLGSTTKPRDGPQYEEVELKPFPNGPAQNGAAVHGYDVPKPLTDPESSQPLVYQYAATSEVATKDEPSMLGDTIVNNEQFARKKSIYDSDDEVLINASKPSPPPRTKLPQSQEDSSDVYSYAIVPDNARRSVKVKGDVEETTECPPYDTLEHVVGSDVPAHQIRLSKVEGSGYETLKNENH